MHAPLRRRPAGSQGCGARPQAGFTLAEMAITIAIVAIALSSTMQALQSAQITAGHSRNVKVARELAMTTLSEIATGRWWDDILTERTGSYAEQDYPLYTFELAIGDETFSDSDGDYYDPDRHDTYLYREQIADIDDEEEEAAQAFEKVQVRVTFPRLSEKLDNQVSMELWIPWAQVYGEDEELEDGRDGLGTQGGGPGGGSQGGGPGGGAGGGPGGGQGR